MSLRQFDATGRWTPWVWILLLNLLGTQTASGCRRPQEAKSAKESSQESALPPVAKEEVQTFRLSSTTDDGRKRWEVSGTSADLMAEVIRLTDVTATNYGAETNVTLTAREGAFDRRTRHIHLEQDVKAVTTEGTTLTTPAMEWDAERRVATTEEWTTVQRQNLTVHGLGAFGAPDLKQVRFHRKVRVEIAPATTITCRGPLEIDYERHRARFWSQVHVQDARGQIWADRMDVRLDPATRQLADVQCWGHVRILREGQLARSHRAIYRRPRGRMVLIGHPKVVFLADQDPTNEQRAAP